MSTSTHIMPAVRRVVRNIPFAKAVYARCFLLFYLWEKLKRKRVQRTYAQQGEDLKVGELLGHVGFFIDIGAHDGISGSNTFYWALRGARGICFEPVRQTYQKLRSLYLLNRRVICKNCGVSDRTRQSEIVALDFLSYLPETEDRAHSELQKQWHKPQRDVRSIKLLTLRRCNARSSTAGDHRPAERGRRRA